MINITRPRPMAPATILLFNASAPMVAVSTEELISFSVAGSAPPRIKAEVEEASSSLNPPDLVISQLLEVIFSLTLGAETTSSSSLMTIAVLETRFPSSSFSFALMFPAAAFSVAAENLSEPLEEKSIVILYPPFCVSVVKEESVMSLPLITSVPSAKNSFSCAVLPI